MTLARRKQVKYTTSLPCIGLSESDLRLYPNFEFCEGKNHKHLENTFDVQSQAIYVDNKKFKKSLHILEDGVSNVQVEILNMEIV